MQARHFLLAMFMVLSITPQGNSSEAPRVILLETMTLPLVQEHSKWFLRQMSEMGYEEGKSIRLALLNAEGSTERAEKLLNDAIKEEKALLVVTNATLASKVAKKLLSGTGTPLLFFGVSDPVGAGLIEAVGKATGSNITGKVHNVPRDTIVELILRSINTATRTGPVRFGYIHSDYPSSRGDIKGLQAAARKREDVLFVTRRIPYLQGDKGKAMMQRVALDAIGEIEGKVDFWWQPRGPLGINPDFTKLLLTRSSVPIVYGATMKSVKMGALINIGTDPETQGRETAIIADSILKGQDAGTIPPTRPGRFQVGLNLATVLELKLAIPSEVMRLAEDNIYR